MEGTVAPVTRPLRIAALVKQIPKAEHLRLGPDGRLVREGLELEMNAYCRRAVSKGAELAQAFNGTCTVFTLGPEPAEDVLREAVAWGATDAVLVSDPVFAGSDTLATARALAAALTLEGHFDLILVGRNSVDADTGQVGPELAELLGLPFATGVRQLELEESCLTLRCEQDDGWVTAAVELPAVLSVAERLCEPTKVDATGRAAVSEHKIRRLTARDLGPGPWGQAGSPTSVGPVRVIQATRQPRQLTGDLDRQVDEAMALLMERGALEARSGVTAPGAPVPGSSGAEAGGPLVAVLVEPGRASLIDALLGSAAMLARRLGGSVTGVGAVGTDGAALGRAGADLVVAVTGSDVEEDVAAALSEWVGRTQPEIVLAPSTSWGREVASRMAARLGAGLTGDAVELDLEDGRLVAWKPAFGGALVAAIRCSSPVQMATVRPGVLPQLVPRSYSAPVSALHVPPRSRLRVLSREREDDLEALASAEVVIGLGCSIPPERYGEIEELRLLLGAELGTTRKVTDRGWMPRSRQIGITGRAVAPRLYVALGVSGKFNHMIGVRRAETVLAVNLDPEAPIFAGCDIGIVGDWAEVVPRLTGRLQELTLPAS